MASRTSKIQQFPPIEAPASKSKTKNVEMLHQIQEARKRQVKVDPAKPDIRTEGVKQKVKRKEASITTLVVKMGAGIVPVCETSETEERPQAGKEKAAHSKINRFS
jgi:hypothetical protein